MSNFVSATPSTERLFFALWPDEQVRQVISQVSQPMLLNINGKMILSDCGILP